MLRFLDYALLGLGSGGGYALLALGIIVVHRGCGVVNFAQGAIATTSAYIFWKLHAHAGFGLLTAGAPGLAGGALIGSAFYWGVGRRLTEASGTAKVLVALGLLLMLQAILRLVWTNQQEYVPNFLAHDLVFADTPQQALSIVLVVAAVVLTAALSFVFARTRFGLVTTALQDSPMGAQSLGLSPHPWAAAAWAISGVLAAITGILLLPMTALSPNALGPFMIPALGVAYLAGFRRFWLALAVGLAAGVAQSVAIGLDLGAGFARSIPSFVVLAALVLRGHSLPGRGTVDMPRLFRVGTGRTPLIAVATALGALSALVTFLPDYWSDTFALTAILAIVGLSIVISTGYAGQISLLPLGLTGAAVLFSGWLSQHGAPLPLTILGSAAVAAVAGLFAGLIAARLRGIEPTLATLALAGIIETWLFTSDTIVNGAQGWTVADISLFGFSVDNTAYPRRFAALCWIAATLVALSLAAIRGSRVGRRLLAARSDERAAAASGVYVPEAKVAAYAFSGAIVGVAGALLAVQSGTVGGSRFGEGFSYIDSLGLLATTVLSGVGFVAGGILTGIFSPGGLFPQLLSFGSTVNDWIVLLLSANLVFVLVSEPDGIAAQWSRGTAILLVKAWNRFGARPVALKPAHATIGAQPPTDLQSLRPLGDTLPHPALVVRDLQVKHGVAIVVDNVSFTVEAGTVLAIMGANGAGKSSLIDAISGFTPVAGGSVVVAGQNMTRLPPHRRVAGGLARTFQDYLLFDDLSVRENLTTAAEPKDRLAYGLAPLGLARRTSGQSVAAAAAITGIAAHLDTIVETLSLGWQARVALARALVTRPRVLCLDEPAAALSADGRQRTIGVIRRIADELGIAILLVEHNTDVVVATCDQAIVMDAGRIIARGRPRDVLRDPDVIRAYLGEEPS